jgi:hypothetical protein
VSPRAKNSQASINSLIRGLDADVILRVAGMCDGHGILDPQALIEAGLPEPVVRQHTRTLRSDGTLKGSLFVNGRAVQRLRGVYGLTLLMSLADTLDVAYPERIGRGSQAGVIQSALHRHLTPPAR